MTKTTTVRLTDAMAEEVTIVGRIDGLSMNEVICKAVSEHCKKRLFQPDFKEKLQKQIEHDRRYLEQQR